MGVGIRLIGRLEGSKSSLDARDAVLAFLNGRCEPMLRSLHAEGVDERVMAYALLHPAAENIVIDLSRPGLVDVDAKTSTLGPGYHAFVVTLIRELGDAAQIEWDPALGYGDETRYFETGNRDDIEARMLDWLAALATRVRDDVARGVSGCAINLASDHRYSTPGAVRTPLGPRDEPWLEAVAKDPTRGIDLFPWWSAGEGFDYRLGRALTLMWKDVRWRRPLNAGELRDLEEVHRLLAAAFAIDDRGDLPFRAWAEVVDVLALDDEVSAKVRARSKDSGEAEIGYRRHPVRVAIGGHWSLEIPGSFAEAWDEDGTWTAFDARGTVLASTYAMSAVEDPEGLLDRWYPKGPDTVVHEGRGWRGRATFAREESDTGSTDWSLRSLAIGKGGIAALTVIVGDGAQREWAMELWRSLEA